MKKAGLIGGGLAVISAICLALSPLVRDSATKEWEHCSRAFYVDQVYPAMVGPSDQKHNLQLSEQTGELLWMTGFSADVIGPGEVKKPSELICHSAMWMECKPKDYRALWGTDSYGSSRFFTLAQGQTELAFPEGFGLPIPAGQTFMLATQLLNEWEEHKGQTVSHLSKVQYQRHSEVSGPMTPLVLFESTARVYLDPEIGRLKGYPVAEEMPTEHSRSYDNDGATWNAHWLVPKGRHHYPNPLELNLPFDTTAHYIAIHLHRFAEKCDIVDKTTGEVIFTAKARHERGRLVEVDHYSSKEGIPFYKDHEYEMVATYNNPLEEPQGAMAIAFFYFEDKEFRMPDPKKLAPVPPIVGEMKDVFCTIPGMEAEPSMSHTGKGLED